MLIEVMFSPGRYWFAWLLKPTIQRLPCGVQFSLYHDLAYGADIISDLTYTRVDP